MPEHGDIEIISDRVAIERLTTLAEGGFGDLVKAVVDVDRGVMAIGGGLHADEEAILLDLGSDQSNLWGINLYPAEFGKGEWIEFDSMVNVRPKQGNRSRSVEDLRIRDRIADIVGRLVVR